MFVPHRSSVAVQRGERAPFVTGVRANEAFYSFNEQAGRSAVLLHVGALGVSAAAPFAAAFHRRASEFEARTADVLCLVDTTNPNLSAYAAAPLATPHVVFCPPEVLRPWLFDPREAAVVVIDRNARVIALIPSADPDATADAALAALATCAIEPPRDESTPAPVLVIPNVFDAPFCRRLIEYFDRGERTKGGMASVDPQGKAFHKIDEAKKRRLDCVVRPNDAIHQPVIEALARACLPEIKRAFQIDASYIDRILIARYETGGCFMRHRDNSAPAVAFRQFAMSINLNTGQYDGGHLLFPEYNDHRYNPSPGAALVFSATLLHEATPVLKGERYVLLTFVHNAEAEALRRRASQRKSGR
jgi:predicted 2-oxoglutarate/Fe(II)-dependent dioxygenase YbiX